MNARDACSCEDFCVRDHVLPLDAQNNPQTCCMEVVEFSSVAAVHDSHAYNRRVSTTAMYTFNLVSWLIPRLSHTFFLSRPNAELALESMLLTSTSMLASLERLLPR